MIHRHIRPRRLVAVFTLAAALVVAAAGAASAHATLVTTEPQPGAVLSRSPGAITLRFDEPVEVSLGGIRVFDGSGSRVDARAPEHPRGSANRVRVSVPELGNGSYVVTWRVTSADSHPVQGAFTFQVGPNATVKNAKSLAARLLSSEGGSTVVGVAYAIVRYAVFAGLALLIGGVVFLVLVFPRGRDSRVTPRLILGGWVAAFAGTTVGIGLEGAYAAGLPISKVFDPDVFRDVLDTRFGKVWLARLVLLLVALPLLRVLIGRRPAAEYPLSPWWIAAVGLVGAGLALTPGLSGHAATGDHTVIAIPADAVHFGAMSVWLGGLVLLVAVVLPRRDPDELRRVLPRYSALALGAIVALVVSGGFQAWRQVGTLSALRSTDYGRLLIVKLLAFASLIVAAAFSREVVNRRFRMPHHVSVPASRVPVGVGGPRVVVPVGAALAYVSDDDAAEEAAEIGRLRRSVAVELVVAAAVLVVTALLVNAAPARSVTSGPAIFTMKSARLWVDVVVAPGAAGANDVHITALTPAGGLADVQGMEVQLSRPGQGIAPITVPLRKLGPGHYVAPGFDIPIAGEWQLTARALLSATDEAVLSSRLTLR